MSHAGYSDRKFALIALLFLSSFQLYATNAGRGLNFCLQKVLQQDWQVWYIFKAILRTIQNGCLTDKNLMVTCKEPYRCKFQQEPSGMIRFQFMQFWTCIVSTVFFNFRWQIEALKKLYQHGTFTTTINITTEPRGFAEIFYDNLPAVAIAYLTKIDFCSLDHLLNGQYFPLYTHSVEGQTYGSLFAVSPTMLLFADDSRYKPVPSKIKFMKTNSEKPKVLRKKIITQHGDFAKSVDAINVLEKDSRMFVLVSEQDYLVTYDYETGLEVDAISYSQNIEDFNLFRGLDNLFALGLGITLDDFITKQLLRLHNYLPRLFSMLASTLKEEGLTTRPRQGICVDHRGNVFISAPTVGHVLLIPDPTTPVVYKFLNYLKGELYQPSLLSCNPSTSEMIIVDDLSIWSIHKFKLTYPDT